MEKRAELPNVSDNWNVAGGYVTSKILIPLVLCDKHVRIAQFGAEHIENSIYMNNLERTSYRVEAVKRLIDELKRIIENSIFALKKPDKEKFNDLKKKINKVEEYLGALTKITTDSRNKQETLTINEDHFNLTLLELRRILADLPIPLNDNALIFPSSEEFDFDKIKESLIYGG
ncbi:MAG: hypothetical protein WD512_11000 [Candidatus Paceibacterota bacterium]